MEWGAIKAIFEWDGSLRDIYVLDTTRETWQQFLDFVRVGAFPYTFSVDGQPQPLPEQAGLIFARQAEVASLLAIWVGGMQLNCHFFTEDEIELDLDPREVPDAAQAEQLWAFMRTVGTTLNQEVRLACENQPNSPLVRFDPQSGQFSA